MHGSPGCGPADCQARLTAWRLAAWCRPPPAETSLCRAVSHAICWTRAAAGACGRPVRSCIAACTSLGANMHALMPTLQLASQLAPMAWLPPPSLGFGRTRRTAAVPAAAGAPPCRTRAVAACLLLGCRSAVLYWHALARPSVDWGAPRSLATHTLWGCLAPWPKRHA
eukprot:356870-Chlamydomonas_euryale.AAC.4